MSWNHAICDECWEKRSPGRVPVRVRDVGESSEGERFVQDVCCFCNKPTRGIYVRHDPVGMTCKHSEV